MKIISFILDLLYPRKCVFCHRTFKPGDMADVCAECADNLPYTGTHQGRNVQHTALCICPLYYRDNVKKSLHRYKFCGLQFYSGTYARIMWENTDLRLLDFDVISYVPLSRKRLRTRGYDQARLIAEELSKLTGKKCVRLLYKVRNTKKQSQTGGAEARTENIKGAYSAIKTEASGKRILLIDDIVTTGSTLSEAAAALTEAGASRIYAAAVATSAERN